MASHAARSLADYLEAHKEMFTAIISKALRPAIAEQTRQHVTHWVDSQIDQLRGGPDRGAEWAALLVENTRAAGEDLNEALEQVRMFRRVALDYCRGRITGLSDAELFEVVHDIEDRQVSQVVAFCRHMGEETLVSERRRQRVLLEAIGVAFVTLTPEGVIDSANEYFARIAGCPLDSLMGKELNALCDEGTAAELRRIVRQKRSVGSHVFNGYLISAKGQRNALRFTVRFIFDARGWRAGIAILFDTATPREFTFKDCLAYLGSDILNTLPIPLQIFDRDRAIVYANEASRQRRTPVPESDAPYCCQIMRLGGHNTGTCICHQVFETGLPHLQEVCFGEDKSQQWFQMHLVPLREPQGELTHLACALRDVTEERVLARTLENQVLAQQRTSLASQLAVTVAHQLRNPLSVIIGFAEMLARGLPAEQVMSAVDKLLRNGLRCKEIVEDLLEFGQGLPGERVTTDLNALVRSVVQPMFPASLNRRIAWRLAAEPVPVECVPHQLGQVFVNLVENGLRAAADQVIFDVTTKADRVVVRIKDDGPGIPAELRDKVFQPFFTTHGEEGALGLGLSLSQSVVAEYGGKLYIEDLPEGGACFTVRLPLALHTGLTPLPQEEQKESPFLGKRILVVDDEVDLLDMLTIVLEQRGYRVDAAGSAAKAIDLLQKKTYDAVVLDVQLPGDLSGPQLYAYLTQAYPGLVASTMFITADTMNYETRRFLDKVQRPSMEKPFLVSEFLEQIVQLFQE